MITAITSSNINVFKNVLPDDVAKNITMASNWEGIGDYRFEGKTLIVTGALAYCSEKTEDANYLNIKWLYVAKNERDMGVGATLITEFYWNMIVRDSDFAICDIPAAQENEELINLLTSWRFQFEPMNSNIIYVPVSVAVEKDIIKKTSRLSDKMIYEKAV